jgi:hypothetical protein
MVACHFNFQFQVLAVLKGTTELGVTHFTVDAPLSIVLYIYEAKNSSNMNVSLSFKKMFNYGVH